MTFSSLIRLHLQSTSLRLAAFHDLRSLLHKAGITSQYFGYTLSDQGFPKPRNKDEMNWIVQWPHPLTAPMVALVDSLSERLQALDRDANPTELCFEMKPPAGNQSSADSLAEMERALAAPVCQFAIICLAPNAPLEDTNVQVSMGKTFTDCYFAPGFAGGAWGYSLRCNDSKGVGFGSNYEREPKKELLAYYYLGWETLEHHHSYAGTTLFDEEIDKLSPHFGDGTGAFYAKLERHSELRDQ